MQAEDFSRSFSDYVDANSANVFKSLMKPNPMLVAMMGHHKWYVRLFLFAKPRYIHTYTTYEPYGVGGLGRSPVGHGYTCHHPLEFLYNAARRIAARKMKFRKLDRIQGATFTIPLRGKLGE